MMNNDFVKLVHTEYEKIRNGESCFYIGEGNPDADILIIGNECARNDNGEEVAAYNVQKWKELLDRKYNVEDIGSELKDYKGAPGNDEYYPLFPWFGQKCIVRSRDGKRGPDGTARTWVQYQKLIDAVYGRRFCRDNFVDFHLYAFHTELSQIPRMRSGKKNDETAASIHWRLEQLFRQPFFQQFPVVVIAAGHYLRDYVFVEDKDKIINTFNVEYDGNCGDETEWINIHSSCADDAPDLLVHTRHFAGAISDGYIEKIARHIRGVLSSCRKDQPG